MVRCALARARVAVEHLAENATVETVDELQADSSAAMLYAALWILDEGRRYARGVLETCDEFIHTIGSETDEVQQELHSHISHAIVRLSGALETRLEPEALPSDQRRALVHRAVELAAGVLAHPIDGASMTDQQCLAFAVAIVSERLAIVGQRQPVTRCSWCVRAGVRSPPLRHDDPAVSLHLLECPHSPTAAAYRSLREMAEIVSRRGVQDRLFSDGLTLGDWVSRAVAEVERIRVATSDRRVEPPRETPRMSAGDLAIRTLHEVLDFINPQSRLEGDQVQRLADTVISRLSQIDASLAREATDVSEDALLDRLRDAVAISESQLLEVLEACHPNVADRHLTASLGDDAPNLSTLYNHAATALQLEGAVAARRVVAEVYTRWQGARRAAQ